MSIRFVYLFAALMLIPLIAVAEIIAPQPLKPPVPKEDHSHDYIMMQVIQDQFVLDNSTVRHAGLITRNDGSFGGLKIILKPQAVSTLERITQTAVGKNINLMVEKKIIAMPIIQTPLSGTFIIASISKEDAQAFIRALNLNKDKVTTLRAA